MEEGGIPREDCAEEVVRHMGCHFLNLNVIGDVVAPSPTYVMGNTYILNGDDGDAVSWNHGVSSSPGSQN